jgi:hypothetical protein
MEAQVVQIDAKTAVGNAVAYVSDMYKDEHITDVLLEEIEMNEAETAWRVTVGFTRVMPMNPLLAGDLAKMFSLKGDRLYKVIEVDAVNGAVRSMKIRDIHSAA